MRDATTLRVRTMSSAGEPPPLVVFDRAGARDVDRIALTEFGLPGVVLMENAGAALARVCFEALGSSGELSRSALLLCGPGNNGGDGYACARRLHNAGVRVGALALGEPKDPASDAGINLRALRAMGAEVRTLGDGDPARTLDALVESLGAPGLLVDALLGTGLDRALGSPFTDAVRWMNRASSARTLRVVSADIPTGLDADSGAAIDGLAVRAGTTVAFAGLKSGFFAPAPAPSWARWSSQTSAPRRKSCCATGVLPVREPWNWSPTPRIVRERDDSANPRFLRCARRA